MLLVGYGFPTAWLQPLTERTNAGQAKVFEIGAGANSQNYHGDFYSNQRATDRPTSTRQALHRAI